MSTSTDLAGLQQKALKVLEKQDPGFTQYDLLQLQRTLSETLQQLKKVQDRGLDVAESLKRLQIYHDVVSTALQKMRDQKQRKADLESLGFDYSCLPA
jgi:septation ring formation regulator EzrA